MRSLMFLSKRCVKVRFGALVFQVASHSFAFVADAVKLQQSAPSLAAKSAPPAVSEVAETAARIQARGEEDRQKVCFGVPARLLVVTLTLDALAEANGARRR